jgi:hypothetical protein
LVRFASHWTYLAAKGRYEKALGANDAQTAGREKHVMEAAKGKLGEGDAELVSLTHESYNREGVEHERDAKGGSARGKCKICWEEKDHLTCNMDPVASTPSSVITVVADGEGGDGGGGGGNDSGGNTAAASSSQSSGGGSSGGSSGGSGGGSGGGSSGSSGGGSSGGADMAMTKGVTKICSKLERDLNALNKDLNALNSEGHQVMCTAVFTSSEKTYVLKTSPLNLSP